MNQVEIRRACQRLLWGFEKIRMLEDFMRSMDFLDGRKAGSELGLL